MSSIRAYSHTHLKAKFNFGIQIECFTYLAKHFTQILNATKCMKLPKEIFAPIEDMGVHKYFEASGTTLPAVTHDNQRVKKVVKFAKRNKAFLTSTCNSWEKTKIINVCFSAKVKVLKVRKAVTSAKLVALEASAAAPTPRHINSRRW